MVNRTGSHTLQMAPRVGFEPTTLRLTAGCSAVELPRNTVRLSAQVRIIPEPSHCARPNFKEFRRLCNSAPFGHRLSIRADEAEAPGALPSPLPRTGSERADADPTEGRRASTDPANRRPANGKGVSWMVLTEIRLRSSPARESRRKGGNRPGDIPDRGRAGIRALGAKGAFPSKPARKPAPSAADEPERPVTSMDVRLPGRTRDEAPYEPSRAAQTQRAGEVNGKKAATLPSRPAPATWPKSGG